MEFEEVRRIMQNEKARIVGLNQAFTQPGVQGTFGQVEDNTQSSVFLQHEIEEFTTEFTAGKNLTTPGAAFITHRVHDQRMTNLCTSYATTTLLRSASMRYLVSQDYAFDQIRDDLENVDEFSHSKMLTIFTGCVSPRSLDGLIINSRNDARFINAQTKIAGTALDRLVSKTALEENGWIRIDAVFLRGPEICIKLGSLN